MIKFLRANKKTSGAVNCREDLLLPNPAEVWHQQAAPPCGLVPGIELNSLVNEGKNIQTKERDGPVLIRRGDISIA